MDLLYHMLDGFGAALSLMNLMWIIIGALLGTLIGILPGLGNPAATLAILLPLTLRLPPATGLIMMAGIYNGSKFAGATTAILLNIPTETSSVVLCYDGHELAKQGRAGAAMGMSAISGFIASTIGVIGLTFAAPVAARIAIDFGPPEFAMLMIFGLLLVISLAGKSPVKGLIAMFCGLLVSTIGADIFSGVQRFTFGSVNLYDGIEFLVVTLGLFAVGEVLINTGKSMKKGKPVETPKRLRDYMPTWADLKQSRLAIAIGTLVGFFIGALPGGGSTIASFVSYAVVKKYLQEFGKIWHRHHRGRGGSGSGQQLRMRRHHDPAAQPGFTGQRQYYRHAGRPSSLWHPARSVALHQPSGNRLAGYRQSVSGIHHLAYPEPADDSDVGPDIAYSLLAALSDYPAAGGGRRLQRPWFYFRCLSADGVQRLRLYVPSVGRTGRANAHGVCAGT
ncbi:tripartite tricarboxylate transporter permease [Acerihabitans sp. KWT182]|uniref:Tripartite tricarboxylate transporter permease n=1 Tax=Acerihabitans sp. KWT182 TaxID=3157919 RepID=A0AAU7QDX1_9GAMM